jgi:dipeptidyl aminopeptidase/acylaminoacyl peptidase
MANVTFPLATFLSACLCLAADEDVAPKGFLVRSYDGASVPAAIRKPAGKGPFPAIMFIHGGVGGSTTEGMERFAREPVPDHFFRKGFVVMAADYRRYHFGEDEIQDVMAALRELRALPYVDPSRVAVIGGSHGGYLAKMLASRTRPAAVVSYAGPADIEGMFFDVCQFLAKSIAGWEDWRAQLLRKHNRERTETIRDAAGQPIQVMGTPLQPGRPVYEIAIELAYRFGDRRELYRAISPKENVGRIQSPLLYLAGGEDGLRFAGVELVRSLKARGVTAEYSEHAGMPHGFYWGGGENPPRQFHEALKVTAAFIEKHLKGGSAPN